MSCCVDLCCDELVCCNVSNRVELCRNMSNIVVICQTVSNCVELCRIMPNVAKHCRNVSNSVVVFRTMSSCVVLSQFVLCVGEVSLTFTMVQGHMLEKYLTTDCTDFDDLNAQAKHEVSMLSKSSESRESALST